MKVMYLNSKTYLLEAEEIETLEKALKILENVETDMDKDENSYWYMPSQISELITKIYLQAKVIDDFVLAE